MPDHRSGYVNCAREGCPRRFRPTSRHADFCSAWCRITSIEGDNLANSLPELDLTQEEKAAVWGAYVDLCAALDTLQATKRYPGRRP